jgi:hypothetical protein
VDYFHLKAMFYLLSGVFNKYIKSCVRLKEISTNNNYKITLAIYIKSGP